MSVPTKHTERQVLRRVSWMRIMLSFPEVPLMVRNDSRAVLKRRMTSDMKYMLAVKKGRTEGGIGKNAVARWR